MGTTASGSLRADPGGFTGRLTLAGGGMAGDLLFSPVGGDQKIEAHLTANGVRFAGPPALSVQSGRIDGTILLAEGATSMDGVVIARGLQSGAIRLSRLTANAKLVNGRGEVRAAMAGQRGSAFEFVTLANVAPGRITINGRGPGRPQAVRAGQRGGADGAKATAGGLRRPTCASPAGGRASADAPGRGPN